ncbi:MAG: hypothetical protein ACP5MZ_00140 [Candidatus Micrarchaeia archaeon]
MVLPGILLQITSISSVKSDLLPIVVLALLLDSVIVSTWYVLGILLNNSKVKDSARGEFYQLAGTAVITVIILTILVFAGSIFSLISSSGPMSTSNMSTMCSSIESNSPLSMLGSGSFSLLAGISSSEYPVGYTGPTFGGLCNYISTQSSAPTATTNIDYPLASAGVVIANLTNQSIVNLNSFFEVDFFLGYMETITPSLSFCLQDFINPAGPCMIPPEDVVNPAISFINATYTPYAGYSMVYKPMGVIGELLGTSLEMDVAQLLFIIVFLYIWPYILFIGLIFRATPFTRRIGGLFIAIAIGAVLFYPAVFAIEYVSLSGMNVNSEIGSTGITLSTAYGFNGITTNSITALPDYTPNFFVEPSIENIAQANSCWPPGGNMALTQAEDTGILLVPFASAIDGLLPLIKGASGGLPSSLPYFYLPSPCTPTDAEGTMFQILNAYGITGITAYVLPLINILITLTAIIGLSGLLGGDTSLAGLSRLV